MGMVTYQGKEYEELPDFAREAIAANLSRVVSLWYSNHPEEYKAFLEWKKKKEAEKAS
jgi:hypothetical protein